MSSHTPATGMRDIVPFPAELVDEYRAQGIWDDLSIGSAFSATAEAYPNLPAVLTPTARLTYAELDRRTDQLAAGLLDLGLRPSERVLLQITNVSWAVVAWYGLLKAGLVPIATLAHHRRHEIVEIARQAEPAAHLVQADFPGHDLVGLARDVARAQPSLRVLLTINAANPTNGAIGIESLGADRAPADARVIVDSVQHGIAPDSLAVLQLSGGTTNVPKLIPRLHAEYWYNAKAYARAVQLKPGDCVAHILPVVHNAGIVCGVHAAHSVGSCFATAAHDPAEITALVRRQPPTHMMMAPPIAQMVLADDDLREALRSLRRMVWTLGKLPPQVREVFETDTCMIQQLYGQGEGLCMVTPAEAPPEIRHHTVGAPVCAFDEIRVYFPNTENPVPVGVPGELCCRGPYTLRGYYRAPERNIEAFTSDGFYRSGDIVVELQAPGGPFYAVEDRLKDVISRGGEKINALEVEELLVRHAAIEAAALVAMPDERLGERACAVLVLRDGAEAPGIEDLRAFLDDLGVAKFKWPERIELRDALPLTSVDKVNKALLRREVADILAAKR